MKRYLIVLAILLAGAVAWANPFGNPLSGGGGGSGNATSITDNLIVNADINSAAAIDGSKLADNTVDTPKIKLNGGSGGYSLFLDQTNRINFAHYNNTGTRVIRIDSYDDGEIYLESEPAGPYISIGTGGTDNITVSAGEIRIMATGYDLSNTELSYLDNVTSSIQGQLDNIVGGTGTVTGPAVATEDNVVTWGADNTSIKDGGVALSALARLASPTFTGTVTLPTVTLNTSIDNVSKVELEYLNGVTSAIQGQLDLLAPLVSPSFTTPTLGVATATTLDTGQGANELYDMNQNVQTTDNVTFATVTAGEFISSAADGTHKGNVANSGAASNLTTAGDFAYNLTTGALTIYDNVVADNVILAAAVKTFSFGIDNVVVATDNILLTRVPRAWTITRADCYASTDNVVGDLMECATDNVTSCTVLDSWTVTNAVSPFTDSSMTDGAVAAGAWLRWSTTSVGTTNSNKLSCTVQYRE